MRRGFVIWHDRWRRNFVRLPLDIEPLGAYLTSSTLAGSMDLLNYIAVDEVRDSRPIWFTDIGQRDFEQMVCWLAFGGCPVF